MSQKRNPLYSLKTIEKIAYMVGIPAVLGYVGYTLYHKS